jgi:phosphotriesterase-related protein
MQRREFLAATTALVGAAGAGVPVLARSQGSPAAPTRIAAAQGAAAQTANRATDLIIQTSTGPMKVADMGRTLIHEHLFNAVPGWEFDHRQPPFDREKAIHRCVDILQELQHYGCRTVVDPLPMDMGRDVEFIAEVSQRSGTRVICATGFYNEHFGAPWTVRWLSKEQLVELYVTEITEGVSDSPRSSSQCRGVGQTGIRCGVIKIATDGAPTEYERKMLGVTAEASRITGVPIISHTNGSYGLEQVDLIENGGVPTDRLVVGHCDRDDPDYNNTIAKRGAFVGLDRFGFKGGVPDTVRMKILMQLVRAGHRDRILVSHDCNLSMRGNWPKPTDIATMGDMSHFMRDIAPQLLSMGLSKEDLERILVDNPRALFTNAAKKLASTNNQHKAAG